MAEIIRKTIRICIPLSFFDGPRNIERDSLYKQLDSFLKQGYNIKWNSTRLFHYNIYRDEDYEDYLESYVDVTLRRN